MFSMFKVADALTCERATRKMRNPLEEKLWLQFSAMLLLAPIDSAVPLLSPSHSTSCVSFVVEARYISAMGSIPFTAHSRITTWRCCGLKITYFHACWMKRASSWRQSPPKINPWSDEKERKTYMSMSVSVFLWAANKTSGLSPLPHINTLVINTRPCFGGELTSRGSFENKRTDKQRKHVLFA